MRQRRRNDNGMELNYAIDKVRQATYHDAKFFSDDFKEALHLIIVAAERYGNIKKALQE